MKVDQRKHPILVVTEGEDEEGLVTALIKHLSLPDCDVINAEGSGNLKPRTTAAMKIPGPTIRALAIVRDAESDAVRAAASARDILNGEGFEAPSSAFQVARNTKGACGYAILPDGQRAGSIEDICLQSTRNVDTWRCVNLLFECLEKSAAKGCQSEQVERKARVQTYLAACATDRVVHRAGLGFMKGHFDLDSACLAPMREFLQALLK